MRELLEQGVGLAIIGGVTAVGVLVRILLLGYYGMLGRACGRFEETKNKTVAYIREDLRRRAEREQEIKNVSVYTEYRLAEGRIFGFRVGSLEHTVPYSLLLAGGSSVLLSLAGILKGCEYATTLNILFLGGVSVTGLLVLDVLTGLREKSKRVRLRIRDYIENSRATCRERELKKEEKSERRRKKTEKREMKNRSTDKPNKAGKKKNGKAQEEKRRLTEELLRERRQLEARSLAEQRRKEREEVTSEQTPTEIVPEEGLGEKAKVEAAVTECPAEQVQAEAAVTECPAEQVQAEAAVTECPAEQAQAEAAVTESREFIPEAGTKSRTELSYEMLLNEFLKEYPA